MLRPLYILTTVNGTIKLLCLFLGAYFWQLEGIVWSRVGVGIISGTLVYIYLMNHLSDFKDQKETEIEEDYEQLKV